MRTGLLPAHTSAVRGGVFGLFAGALLAAVVSLASPLRGHDVSLATARLSFLSLAAIYIPACVVTGAIGGALRRFMTTRVRAWLIGIPAAFPYTAALLVLIDGLPSGWPKPAQWTVLLSCTVIFGAMGGNIYWTEHIQRSE